MMPATTVTIASVTVAAGLAAQTRRKTRGIADSVPRTESRISFQRSPRFLGLSGSGGSSTTAGPLSPEVDDWASVASSGAPTRLGAPGRRHQGRRGPEPLLEGGPLDSDISMANYR